MRDDLPTSYDPKEVEEKWYQFWEKEKLFAPSHTGEPYCIILPPPNVTGALHMGHALVNTIQDILIRRKRMQGFKTLWVPGTDHAGISTQTVVERHLFATTGKRKADFSRDEFLKQVWLWKGQYEQTILGQLKKLGSSLDWSHLRFTMDDVSTKAVKTMFKKMYDVGLIYRGDYLVNWDPLLQTAIADDEVEHEEKASSLWYFRYPVEDTFITIATTRPETMLGDVAIAVSPKDERYKSLVGKKAKLPFVNRLIPIITDNYVDPTFGSGAVKITPAHDVNDYEIGIRHSLPMINILYPDGTINENGGPFHKMTKETAREEVVKQMRSLGLLEKIEPHTLRVGISYRSKAVIEPYLSKQWFIKMEPFKEKLLNAVRNGKVKIIPNDWEKTYFHWIENLRDWCISRQLWWGHQIPVWYHKDNPNQMICQIEGEPDPKEWIQDPDVLDTWFSSALWPLSTLGWPENTPDLKTFYPTATLITGHDILFFWVARMILMGEYATGQVPFSETFVHGLIYGKSYWRVSQEGNISYVSKEERLSYELGTPEPKDVHCKWEKMSKSKGNVIDPLEIIEQYGADAMRFALTSSVTHARQIDLDRRKFEEYKNFANKLWNAARFVLSNFDEAFQPTGNLSNLTLDDRWILSRLNKTIQKTNEYFDNYTFNEAAREIYQFFWDEFCAYYLELSKPYLFGKVGTPENRTTKQEILLHVFFTSIRLMHPIVPFITEELYSLLKTYFPHYKELSAKACMTSHYPKQTAEQDADAEEKFSLLNEVVYALRNLRAELQIPLGNAIEVFLTENHLDLIAHNEAILKALVKIKSITLSESQNTMGATAIVRGINVFVPLPEELKAKEKTRLTKELEKLSKQTESLKQKLENQDFLTRAPEHLVQQTKEQLTSSLDAQSAIQQKLSHL